MEEFSPEFKSVVQNLSGLMGLTLAFKKKYGDEALEVAKNFGERMGTAMGTQMKKEAGITGSQIEDMEKIFQNFLSMSNPPHEFEVQVEGNTLTMERTPPAVCPGVVAAQQMGVPLELFCNTMTMPVWKGVAKSVNPSAVHTSKEISEKKCIETVEIP